jgi:hypothetical protein
MAIRRIIGHAEPWSEICRLGGEPGIMLGRDGSAQHVAVRLSLGDMFASESCTDWKLFSPDVLSMVRPLVACAEPVPGAPSLHFPRSSSVVAWVLSDYRVVALHFRFGICCERTVILTSRQNVSSEATCVIMR